ncbi:MAG: hypothetical protein AAGA08_01715 [Pseudomonadota bacterium]
MIEFQVFDALVYLVPGVILVASVVLCLRKESIESLSLQPDTFLGIVVFGVAAFSAGFVIHLISGPLFVFLNKALFGLSPLHHATDVFVERQDLPRLKSELEEHLGITTDDFTDLYRYATYAVISSDNPLASRIDRLQSLALMSRNLTATVPIASVLAFCGLRLWNSRRWFAWAAIGLVPIVAGVLHIGAWQFSVATVLATYRSILLVL